MNRFNILQSFNPMIQFDFVSLEVQRTRELLVKQKIN